MENFIICVVNAELKIVKLFKIQKIQKKKKKIRMWQSSPLSLLADVRNKKPAIPCSSNNNIIWKYSIP